MVKWRDAYGGDDGWIGEYDEPAEAANPVTVGFMMPPDFKPTYVVIANTILEYGDGEVYYSGLTYIPDKMVIDTVVL